MKPIALLFATPVFLLASSCSDEAATDEATGAVQEGEVSGEILGGTISDDMLPLEQLRSQSPSARDDPEGAASNRGGSASAASSSSDASSDSAPESAETDQPAPEPASEPATAPEAASEPAPAAPPADAAPTVAPPTDDGAQ
ncbi:MAG: hypothetical protein AAGL10_15825 [Pseudomonadota bacterium]